MALLATTHPTLLDLAKRQDPDGSIAKIIEMLHQSNGILDDMVWQEGNLPTGHRSTLRSGIPTPTWRSYYQGVQPTRTKTVQITFNTGMMENYGEVDKALADLNGNTAEFRFSEEQGVREGFNQEMADTLIYGNETSEPAAFTGLSPYFNDLSAESAENIIDCGGTGSDNASIWLVVWGPTSCHGIIPKGSKAGLQVTDKGQVTKEDIDGSGGMAEMYRTHYRWDAGLALRDWRYVSRACNIDKSLLTKDISTGADIIDIMTQMLELPPDGYESMGRPVFYVPREVRSMLRRQTVDKVKNSTLSMENIAGKKVVTFSDIPVRRVDALAADEARVV